MRVISIFVLLLSISLISVSCSEDYYYEQTMPITDGNWDYDDRKSFDIEIDDIESFFDLILDINHSVNFNYENVYVKINTTFPSGEKVEDQVSLQLADQLDQWEGRCNKNTCDVRILLQNRVYFQDKGLHSISIEQFNRESPLEGVNSLSLKMIKLD